MASNSRRGPRDAVKKPLQEATVTKTAPKIHKSATTTVEEGVRDRIQECLDRAKRPDTSEKTVKIHLFLAHVLMSIFNVTQADLMANDYRH